MTATLVSLLVISVIALVSPLVAGAIPHKPVPEVVLLVFLGALLGPNMAGLFQIDAGVEIVSNLGTAFLFLIAGYEVNVRDLAGNLGRVAAGTWAVCIGIGLFLVVFLFGGSVSGLHNIALAIALSTTAYGTLAPILKERGLTDTPVGKAVTAHGVFGEVLPVLAISILLSTRAHWVSLLILLAFFAIAFVLAVVPATARKKGGKVYEAIESARETSAQAALRFVVVILLVLVAVSAVFDLDIVLGAFAAGFAVRFIIPEGSHRLEHKIEALGFGFFIPVFFVVSGARIDLAAVAADPLALLAFMGMLLLARTVPVFLSTFVSQETRSFSVVQRINVALYSTMALPLIVAVCDIAVDGGFMTEQLSSTLVTAGALTVLVIPVITAIMRTVAEVRPVAAVHDLVAYPDRRTEVLGLYRDLRHEARARYRAVRDLRDKPDYDEAREAGRVLADLNDQRMALLSGLRAAALQQTVDSVAADPAAWERIVNDRAARWEEMKRRGDEAWEHVKALGDQEIDAMRDHGERYLRERLDKARAAAAFFGRDGGSDGSQDGGAPRG